MAGAGASSRGRAPRGHDPWAPKPKEGGIFTKLLRCFMPQLTESGGTSSSTRYDRHRALSKMPSQKGAPPRALYRSRTLGATPMSRADSRRHNQGHSHHRVFDQLPSARSRNGRPELTASASMRSSSRALDANRGSSRPRSRQPRSAVGELLQRFGREPPGRFGRTLDAWAGSGARTEHRRREPSPESRFRRSASARSRRGFATIEAPSAREIRERRSSRHRLGATSFRHLTATAVEDEIARRTSEIEYERFTDDEEAERPAVSLAARSLRKIRSENYRGGRETYDEATSHRLRSGRSRRNDRSHLERRTSSRMSRRSSAYDVDAAAGHGLDDSPARGAPVRSSSRPRSSRAWRQRSRRDEGADADVASSRSAPRQRPAIPAKERSRLLRSTRDSERSSSPVLRESDRSGSTAARRGHSRAPSTPSLVDDQEQSRRTSQPLAAATPGSARSRLSREASASSGSVARPTVFRSATVPSTILGMIAERDEASEPADDEARRRASTKFLGDGADMEDAASTLHNSSRRASRRGESRQCDEDETGSHLSLDRLVKRVHVVPGGIPAMSAINEEQLSRASSGV